MNSYPITLGIFPYSQGFGYAVFDGPKDLIDSDVVRIQPFSSKRCLQRVIEQLEYFKPTLVLLRDYEADVRISRRGTVLLRAIERRAQSMGITVAYISRQQIKETFAKMGAENKYQTAQVIREHLPDCWYRVPNPRKLGDQEDFTMPRYDAMALVLTYYFLHDSDTL